MRIYIMIAIALAVAGAAGARTFRFVRSDSGDYVFDTGVLRGRISPAGKAVGLTNLTHLPTGIELTESPYGLLSHYRVFTSGKRYGHGAWDWPATYEILPDGSVRIDRPAAPGRPFCLTAVYRVTTPDAIDLHTTISAEQPLPQFESFIASYFHRDLPRSSILVNDDAIDPIFADLSKDRGIWQMFPRDRDVLPVIEDGRWDLPPHPVDWRIRHPFAVPVAARRHEKGLMAVLISPAQDCFAIAAPHNGETHYSLYFSLFGKTINPGKPVTAHVRLLVTPPQTPRQLLNLYKRHTNFITTLN